jgi:NhaP-type Na+/H+ or K+/H+ antiporter
MISLAVFVSLYFLYSLFSRRLERTILTAPIVFTVAGMLMFPALPGILRVGFNASARLLSTGMLLTILLGAVAARLVFPHLSIWEAGILAAILAPTDAGLGQIIVNSSHVPMRIH